MSREIILLEAQICVLKDLMQNWEYESLKDLETHMEWLWNDLEEIKDNLLKEELKKEMTRLNKHESNHTKYILA